MARKRTHHAASATSSPLSTSMPQRLRQTRLDHLLTSAMLSPSSRKQFLEQAESHSFRRPSNNPSRPHASGSPSSTALMDYSDPSVVDALLERITDRHEDDAALAKAHSTILKLRESIAETNSAIALREAAIARISTMPHEALDTPIEPSAPNASTSRRKTVRFLSPDKYSPRRSQGSAPTPTQSHSNHSRCRNSVCLSPSPGPITVSSSSRASSSAAKRNSNTTNTDPDHTTAALYTERRNDTLPQQHRTALQPLVTDDESRRSPSSVPTDESQKHILPPRPRPPVRRRVDTYVVCVQTPPPTTVPSEPSRQPSSASTPSTATASQPMGPSVAAVSACPVPSQPRQLQLLDDFSHSPDPFAIGFSSPRLEVPLLCDLTPARDATFTFGVANAVALRPPSRLLIPVEDEAVDESRRLIRHRPSQQGHLPRPRPHMATTTHYNGSQQLVHLNIGSPLSERSLNTPDPTTSSRQRVSTDSVKSLSRTPRRWDTSSPPQCSTDSKPQPLPERSSLSIGATHTPERLSSTQPSMFETPQDRVLFRQERRQHMNPPESEVVCRTTPSAPARHAQTKRYPMLHELCEARRAMRRASILLAADDVVIDMD